ncbi:hypothetical protein RRG08_006185 [Elysia crispata]|uniref:Uncharacterized protein n=1 Tax=Elysia crispata TaxID=231223 RepID=A0AAE1E8P7_9GAST|nr:hypothetical protein RRG08_006185 [Elysia crispata]
MRVRYGGWQSMHLQRHVRTMHGFETQAELDELNAFFLPRTDLYGGAYYGRKQALEVVQNRIDWRGNFSKIITDWLMTNTS